MLTGLKNHIFFYDKIVIGGNLNAVIYAYMKNLPLVMNKYESPFPFEQIEKKYFNILKVPFFQKDKNINIDYKKRIFEYLCFILSLGGNIIAYKNINSIRLKEKNLLLISFENKLITIKFNKIIIFDPTDIVGLNIIERKNNKIMIIDWFNVKKGAQHEYEIINNKTDFIKKIYFFPSARTDGNLSRNKIRKDLLSVSFLKKQEINSIEYSEIYAKLVIEQIMKEKNIHGGKKGYKYDGITPRYRPPIIEHVKREIRFNKKNLIEVSNSIIYNDTDIEEMIENESIIDSYMIHLNNRFLIC